MFSRYIDSTDADPASRIISRHIKEGREHLNFSVFSNYNRGKRDKMLEEIREVIEKDEMPRSSYVWLYRQAKLTLHDKVAIKAWIADSQSEF